MAKVRPNDPCPCGSGKKYKRCCQPLDRMQRLGGGPSGTVVAGVVSPMVTIPDHIPRPEYAESGKPSRRRGDIIKNAEQIAGMRAACSLARHILDQLCAAAKPGLTTDALDRMATALCIEHGCYPSTLNYMYYPKSICTSVNEVICHGIPDSRPLQDGDIVNIDITVYLGGFHGDCSETVLIGEVDEAGQRLVATTRQCLMAGIAAIQPGGFLREIGAAIEAVAKPAGYSVVEAFIGHGIGETFHMDPQVPHYYDPGNSFRVLPGMTFTVEPMINEGGIRHRLWPDDWTAVTRDLKRSAQFEHTVLVTETGVDILTLSGIA